MKTKLIIFSLFVSYLEECGYSYSKETTYRGSKQTIYERSCGSQYMISSVGDYIVNIQHKQKDYIFWIKDKIDMRKNFWKQFTKYPMKECQNS